MGARLVLAIEIERYLLQLARLLQIWWQAREWRVGRSCAVCFVYCCVGGML